MIKAPTLAILWILLVIFVGAPARAESCLKGQTLLRLIESTDEKSLSELKRKAGGDYEIEVIYRAKLVLLKPIPKNYRSFLDILPTNDIQWQKWISIADACHRLSYSIAKVSIRFDRIAADGSVYSLSGMKKYLRYAISNEGVADSDVPEYVRSSCRKSPALFRKAFDSLSTNEKKSLRDFVIDRNCHTPRR